MHDLSLQSILESLADQGFLIGLLLAAAGLTCMFLGGRIVKALVAISFGVLGFLLGISLPVVWPLSLALGILCAVGLGLASTYLSRLGVGILAGIALGSSQSTSRSLMSDITPQEKKTEFFGFYSFFGKASAILGPFVFGIISVYFNQRFAILSVGFFLITGLLLLQRVNERTTKIFSAEV